MMKTMKLFLLVSGVFFLASCNNNAPKNETNPEGGDMHAMDSNASDHTEMGNPDVGGSEMDNHGTDSMGQKTTGGK
jgi:hypothetical protein